MAGTRRPAFLEWGVAGATLPGEHTSGDLHLVLPSDHAILVAVVDGLGHGEEAAEAARQAIVTLSARTAESVITLMRRCHEALLGTRGAVMSLALITPGDDTLSWLAVGNVQGVLSRVDPSADPPRETVPLRGGVVGFHLPPLQATLTPIGTGDLLVFVTDGIRPDFEQTLNFQDSAQRLADRVLARHAKGTDDALVFVGRYHRGAGSA